MQSYSLVHTVETTGIASEPPLYRDLMRKHCRVEWAATKKLYEHFDRIENRDRTSAFCSCRTRAWFVRNRTDGCIRVASNSCRLRWCPLCAKARKNYIRHEVGRWFKDSTYPKFLTVTIKHTNYGLTTQMDHLYRSFQKLRKTKYVKEYCTGGVWFFQMCWNQKKHEWHPHIHAILTGKYMNYKKLRSLWKQCTGDSEVLDIRTVDDAERAAEYVARYAARPCNLSDLPFKQGEEAMKSLYGRRMAGSWGKARGVSFRPKKIPDPENWERMGNWSTVHRLANTDERAKEILKSYHSNLPLGEGYSCNDVDAFIDDKGIIDIAFVEIDPKPPPTLFN